MKKERIPNGKYSREFREAAVKLVTEQGMGVLAAAQKISLPPSTLGHWVKAHSDGKLSEVGKHYKLIAAAFDRDEFHAGQGAGVDDSSK